MHDYCAICLKPSWYHKFADTYGHAFESALTSVSRRRA